ncbi:MAG: SDR family oxidoreductase [Oscillospiraceae bacterium]|nr:SDR family oxidoreductase [Oscillospiraceae bacterium]
MADTEKLLLQGKTALVTGAGRGIGRAIVRRYLECGAVVYANARTAGSLDDLAAEAAACGQTLRPLYFDVTDRDADKRAVMQIRKEAGQIDILVNNAGVMLDERIGMISEQAMHDTFSVNVFAMMELLQLTARIMMRQQSGSIINLSSIVGRNGNAGQLVYSASKGAVIALTKTAAKELAPHHIRVNAIAPGMINTDMFRSISEEHQQERLSLVGMGRIGEPEDVADAAVFLGSDLSSYVTGQVLGVDGAALV